MNSFFTGQVVVCFKPPRNGFWKSRTIRDELRKAGGPKMNETCVIRAIDQTGKGLLLDRYIKVASYADGTEAGYDYRSFRPLVEYKTDISVLKALLVPTDPLPAQRISQP